MGAGDLFKAKKNQINRSDSERTRFLQNEETAHLLVQSLGEHVDTERVVLVARPKCDLSERLVAERSAHDERRVAGGTAKVDETALSEEDKVATRGHGVAVNLGLDIDNLLGVLLEPSDVDLNVEVANAEKRK